MGSRHMKQAIRTRWPLGHHIFVWFRAMEFWKTRFWLRLAQVASAARSPWPASNDALMAQGQKTRTTLFCFWLFACLHRFVGMLFQAFNNIVHLEQLFFKIGKLRLGLLSESKDILEEVKYVGVELNSFYTCSRLLEPCFRSPCHFL